ncbi:unnamed protein product [Polarella glacialis]|uniref:Uncharacterized protein n=1 Tax=Polarella glacialis TaxID=89957 RepID=A0A813J197_POLGL|nr:unnamed protein product [Polarella glacialis]
MDFLEQLDEASFRKQQHAEQERAAKALIKDFQKKCSLAFLKGETECRHEDNMFFYNGNFPTDTSLMLLDKKLQETFGPICKTWVSFSDGRHGIVLAAAWPEPPQRAVQHWNSHGPRSNLISQCPVCLCRAEPAATCSACRAATSSSAAPPAWFAVNQWLAGRISSVELQYQLHAAQHV